MRFNFNVTNSFIPVSANSARFNAVCWPVERGTGRGVTYCVGGGGVGLRVKGKLCSIHAISPIESSMRGGTSVPHSVSHTHDFPSARLRAPRDVLSQKCFRHSSVEISSSDVVYYSPICLLFKS
jgi:hypothetical protein